MVLQARCSSARELRQPYFVLQGNICALLGAKDHLNVFIHDPIAPDPHGLINQGHDNATARGIQIRRQDHLDEAVDAARGNITAPAPRGRVPALYHPEGSGSSARPDVTFQR